ncbi:Usf [Drosophila busckii]|uniref:Usf n=2 Tax=Drosophila busckii TaxID=30019 RepID=A0A0M4F7X2_DROBS|nr:Usf [Drosophila busckii]
MTTDTATLLHGHTSGLLLAHSQLSELNNGAQIFLTICGEEDDNSNESQEFYAIESIKQEPGSELDALHVLPHNLQLPTGCEIYLVKDTTGAAATTSSIGNNIKLEPDSSSAPPSLHYVGGHRPPAVVPASKISPSSSSNHPIATPKPAIAPPAAVKLDAYKKRDDKRRATHNEVERRRRDKINCWIFKLKEMLPTEGNRYKPTTTAEPVEKAEKTGRTPPNDSKSQILIKACDYIKSMQNEIDNLRECLREAESLRLSNQTLRLELEALKQQQELQERFNSNGGGSFNVTLNSLNSSATSDLFDGIDAAPNLSTVSSINFTTKRGLIISDYDE